MAVTFKTLQSGFIRVLISAVFLVGAVYMLRDKWAASISILRDIHWNLFAFVVLLFICINVIVSLRLFLILRIKKLSVSFKRILYLNFIGLFFNLFLPSALGGDAVKAYYLWKDAHKKIVIISSIVFDRLLGLSSLITIALCALPFFVRHYSDPALVSAILTVSVGFTLCVILFFNGALADRFKFLLKLIPGETWKRKLLEFYEVFSAHRAGGAKLFYCFCLSIAVQLIAIYMGFLISRSIGLNISYTVFMLVVPITGLASMIPSMGGLGVREASLIYFLTQHATAEGATAFALAYSILIYGFGLLCGILFMFFGGKVRMKDLERMDYDR